MDLMEVQCAKQADSDISPSIPVALEFPPNLVTS